MGRGMEVALQSASERPEGEMPERELTAENSEEERGPGEKPKEELEAEESAALERERSLTGPG